MGRINVLDKHVAELIAAGEVVERPSSVIKELVENAIDAGATAVTVEIKNGGVSYMRVTDNGCGIMCDDIKNAFLRHATSKVHNQNDLDNIGTLGFRGEALASVCAVARVELLTHSDTEEIGSLYKISGGEEEVFEEAGCPVGTTIIVRELFYNVPARLKFLKKDVSEGNAVSAVMDKIALSHPEIAFAYIKDGKQMFKTAGDANLKSAVYSIYGREFVNTLIPVDYELNGVRVTGYISKPEGARPNRNMQNFFINGRYIKSRTASVALEEAAKGSVMVGKFLSCVLHIQISYSMVDVNVHPAKIEVRFVNERPIFDAVYHAVSSALFRGDERKKLEISSNNTQIGFKSATYDPSVVPKTSKPEKENISYNRKKNIDSPKTSDSSEISDRSETLSSKKTPFWSNISEAPKFNGILRDVTSSERKPWFSSSTKTDDSLTIIVDEKEDAFTVDEKDNTLFSDALFSLENNKPENQHTKPTETDIIPENQSKISDTTDSNADFEEIKPLINTDVPVFRYIGEAFKTYIIFEKNNHELLLIDKHAAHERIIYEQLKNGAAQIFAQGLLSPVIVTLDKTDYDSVLRNISVFEKLHFEVEDFGNGNIIVRAAPQFLEKTDISQTIMEIAGFLTENKQDLNTEKMDWIFHSVACRSAIKSGNVNSEKELIDLARRVEEDKSLRYCPHGRPICIVLTKREIEKHFGRV